MSDTITLRGLRVRGRHGVYEFEREQGQDFVVDVVLELDLWPRAASDDVADTVHYGELADRLAAIVAGEPVNLIETLAERLASACLADAPGHRGDRDRTQAVSADPACIRGRLCDRTPTPSAGDVHDQCLALDR